MNMFFFLIDLSGDHNWCVSSITVHSIILLCLFGQQTQQTLVGVKVHHSFTMGEGK